MIYGYARVSTAGQIKDGHSLEVQTRMLRENGATEIYSDSYTGTRLDRPELAKLIGILQEGDTLIVTKLDRMARSLTDGIKIINDLINRKVRVYILNIGVMDNTPASKLIRNIFFSFAEFERDMMMESTQAGKAIARTKAGFKEGRPNKFTKYQLNSAVKLLETHSYRQVEAMTKISKSTLQRAKKVAMAEKIKKMTKEEKKTEKTNEMIKKIR